MRLKLISSLLIFVSVAQSEDVFNVSEWVSSLSKHFKDNERIEKLATLTKDFSNCILEKNGKIGLSEAKIICEGALQASLSKLGQNLGEISKNMFTEKVREQAVRNLSKDYLERVLTMPIFSAVEKKKFGTLLDSISEAHTGLTFCEMAPEKCSKQLAKDLLSDKNEILGRIKKSPPKSIYSRSKIWKQEYADILKTEEKRRQCPDGSLDKFHYATSVEVKKISGESGLQKYSEAVEEELYHNWVYQIKGGDKDTYDRLASAQSVHENELFSIFKNAIESDWDDMRKAGSNLLTSESFDLSTAVKNHAFEVGQMLYQYPQMLPEICDAVIREQIAAKELDEKNKILKAIETGTVVPSDNLNDVLGGWLTGKTLKCEKVVESYKSKKPTEAQLQALKKENDTLALGLKDTITKADKQIKGLRLNRITIDEAIGIYKGCDSPEFELYKKDIYIRSIRLFQELEENTALRDLFSKHMSATDDDIKKQKMVLLLGFMARLPTSKIPGVDAPTQKEFIDSLVKQFPKNSRPTEFFHDLELLVKDKDLPQCLIQEPKY